MENKDIIEEFIRFLYERKVYSYYINAFLKRRCYSLKTMNQWFMVHAPEKWIGGAFIWESENEPPLTTWRFLSLEWGTHGEELFGYERMKHASGQRFNFIINIEHGKDPD